MKYVDFGYSNSRGIARDGELLRSLGFTCEQLSEDNPEVWDAFVVAGGDDSHSNWSWGYVRDVAFKLTEYDWKTLDDIPVDHFLYKGLIEA